MYRRISGLLFQKKDLKIAKFRLRCTPCHFFKKCPIFSGDFYWPPAIKYYRFLFTHYLHTPLHLFVHQIFCLYNNYLIFFILLKQKKKTDPVKRHFFTNFHIFFPMVKTLFLAVSRSCNILVRTLNKYALSHYR
jgi:hypothetical protein